MFLRAKSKGVHVDTLIRASCVGLVGLDPGEVGTLTLREAVLAVELELGNDDGVLAPAVHIQGGLREHKGSGIRDGGTVVEVGGANKGAQGNTRGSRLLLELHVVGVVGVGRVGDCGVRKGVGTTKLRARVGVGRTIPVAGEEISLDVNGAGIVEGALAVDVGVLAGKLLRATKGVDGVGESINGVRVVEGLRAEHLEEDRVTQEGRAVINVLIGLDDPDKLLHGVVEVELDLVGRRTNRLVASELELSDQVLVGVLGEASALIGIEEHIVNVQRGRNKRLVVGNGGSDRGARTGLASSAGVGVGVAVESSDGPEALVNRSDIKVDLYFVILHITILPHLSVYLLAFKSRSYL